MTSTLAWPSASPTESPARPAATRPRAPRQFALRSLWLTLVAGSVALGYLRAVGASAGFDWPQIGAVFGWGCLLSAPGTLAVGLWAEGPPSRRPAIAMLASLVVLGLASVTVWSLALPDLPVPIFDLQRLWG